MSELEDRREFTLEERIELLEADLVAIRTTLEELQNFHARLDTLEAREQRRTSLATEPYRGGADDGE